MTTPGAPAAGSRAVASSSGSATAADGAVVALIGNPRPGSRTRGLADALVDALLADTLLADTLVADTLRLDPGRHDPAVALDGRLVLELGEIVGISFGGEPPVVATPIADPFAVVRAAKLLVVATPTYKGTYTGLLKVFLDRFGHRELAGVVAVPVAIAASEAHRRSVGTTLTELLVELGAEVPAAPLAVLEPQAADPAAAAAAWVRQHGAAIGAALAACR